MKIRSAEIRPVTMRLTEPYTIAYETVSQTTNVFLRLETDTGLVGFGCAAPDLAVTGESAESVADRFEQQVRARLIDADPELIARIMHDMKQIAMPDPSLRAMVDMALYDLLGKKAGLSVYRLLGGFRDCIPTAVTIGILPVDETRDRAAALVSQGFRALKLKGGADVDMDVERVCRVREHVGPGVELRFDANQGYSESDTIRFFHGVQQAGVELIEQPSPRKQLNEMASISRNVPIPIMADESLMTLRDAFRLARDGLADMVNVKLMKVGGLQEALHINSVSVAAGLEVMVGCMDESALGIAAGLHFALARPNVVYADLDGHLDLLDDPARGAVRIQDGLMTPAQGPGLGFDLDWEKIG